MSEKRCGTCLFWEAREPVISGDRFANWGTCNWTSHVKAPMWLSPPGVLMRPECMAGKGDNCQAWERHP